MNETVAVRPISCVDGHEFEALIARAEELLAIAEVDPGKATTARAATSTSTSTSTRIASDNSARASLPRRVAVVWSEQQRGVWHVHEALPAGTEAERIWTRQVVRYVDAMVRRDSRRPPADARTLLDLERELGAVTRGFYGWGFVDRNPLRRLGSSGRGGGASTAAAYLARNAAHYLGQNADAALEGNELNGRTLRSYVSRRLTMETGVTIRNLRRARYLYVLIRESLPLPEWTVADLEAAWRLLAYSPGAARAP